MNNAEQWAKEAIDKGKPLLSGEEDLLVLNGVLNPRNSDTYELMRRLLKALVHDEYYGFYVYQWIDYHANEQFRLKFLHDIKTTDGKEYSQMYPNANAWTSMNGDGTLIEDKDVLFIRISKKQIGDR